MDVHEFFERIRLALGKGTIDYILGLIRIQNPGLIMISWIPGRFMTTGSEINLHERDDLPAGEPRASL